jgi:DNA (cytosine-5)-methyltransferase 1
MTSYGVRRLTPVECERLQGFPDGWTDPAGSDSARYRTLGNAVTVNVPQWLFRRMKELG